jgi:hypothetical protein
MIFLLLLAFLLGVASAEDAPDPFAGLPGLGAPVVPVLPPVDGECTRAFDLVAGQVVPADLVEVRPDGSVVARCTALAAPVSEALTALARADAFLQVAEERPLVERAWRRELAYWHATTIQGRQPPPFWARPQAQRWIGRFEAYGTVVLAVLLARGLSGVLQDRPTP